MALTKIKQMKKLTLKYLWKQGIFIKQLYGKRREDKT